MNYWIWLASINQLGPRKKKKLLDIYKTPEKIFFANKEELVKMGGITENNVIEMENKKQDKILQKYEAYLTRNQIQMININDCNYPQKLKQIYDPPITLFCIGDISLLAKKSIGIVGSREPSVYGMENAKIFSYQLSKKDIVIVSGMAKGIDAYAHRGALLSGGKTIAVLRLWCRSNLSKRK